MHIADVHETDVAGAAPRDEPDDIHRRAARLYAWVAAHGRLAVLVSSVLLLCGALSLPAGRPALGQTGPNVIHEDTFQATGLPAGDVTGLARHTMWPAGFSLKHVHGGPAYVYVIAGSIDILDGGTTTTYAAGDFFWEHGGHVHTAAAGPQGVEFFILFLLPTGADPTIPVP